MILLNLKYRNDIVYKMALFLPLVSGFTIKKHVNL